MGSPCEPLSPRLELIAELEELGYDAMPGVRQDWSDWRETIDDERLGRIIARIRDDIERRESVEAPGRADEAPPELPDISELVEAIRETVEAADAYDAAHPDEPKTARDETGRRWIASFDRLRSLLKDCSIAMEANFQ
jgi:hypothetical protein